MAEKSRQQQFEREFRGQIGRLAGPVVSALRGIMETSLPDEIGVLSFVIRSRWSSFPVFVHAMDNVLPDEVYFDPPFSGEVLGRVVPPIPPGAIDRDGYEADGVATYEVGARNGSANAGMRPAGLRSRLPRTSATMIETRITTPGSAGGSTSPTSGTDRVPLAPD